MSVEFPPTRVGRRRRRIDPIVPALAMVVAIGALAIAKPWATEEPAASHPAAAPAVVAATVVPTQEPEAARIASVLRPRDGWGIRAIVDRADGFAETWAPAIGGTGDGTFASAFRPDAPVVAIGVTVPSDISVDAVRVWRESLDGPTWTLAPPLVTDPTILLAPSALHQIAGTDLARWAPGAYRVDVLVGRHVRRIALTIPDASGSVPAHAATPSTSADLVGVRETDPSIVRTGMFATMDGRGVALRSVPRRDLDEAAAWSAAVFADHGSAPPVAIVTMPRATGLGVMLTVRAQVRTASIQRLAPEPLATPAVPLGGVSSMRGQVPYVAFELADGGAIEPGVYALSVDWTDETGDHAGTWHVELRPSR